MVARRAVWLLCLLCLLLPAAVLPAAATGDPLAGAGESIEEEYRGFLADVPEDVAERLPPALFPEGESTDFGAVAEAVSEMSGFAYLMGAVGDALSVEWGTAWRTLGRTVGLLLLSAVAGVLQRSIRSEALARTVSLSVSCAMLAVLLSTLFGQLEKVSAFLVRLNTAVNSLLPLMTALHLMGGNVSVAAAQHSSLLLFLSVCENVCNRTVLPMTGLCLALAITQVFSPGLSLKGLTATVKNSYTKTLGFIMLLLSFVLSAQTVLRAASDSLAARTAKFLAGNLIPVVGGALGDTLRTVASAVGFLKSTVGIGAMIILFLTVLPVLVSLLLTRLSLRLSLSVADLLGCETESRLLGELIGIYGVLIAVVSMCTVLMIFALTLFVRVSAA